MMDPLKHDSDQDVPQKEAAIKTIDVADDSEDVDFIAENIREHVSKPLVSPPCETIVDGPEEC